MPLFPPYAMSMMGAPLREACGEAMSGPGTAEELGLAGGRVPPMTRPGAVPVPPVGVDVGAGVGEVVTRGVGLGVGEGLGLVVGFGVGDADGDGGTGTTMLPESVRGTATSMKRSSYA